MNQIVQNIKQRLSLREPLAEALEVISLLTDKLTFKKFPYKKAEEITDTEKEEYASYLNEQLCRVKEVCPSCMNFERDFPSFAFSIATGIGKTRLMGACIAYLYLAKGIRHFFILAPNLTLYEKLIRDFGEPAYEKYVFKGLAEFVHNQPLIITGSNYNSARNLFSNHQIHINIFNISKFNSDSKEDAKKGVPKMRRLSEYLGQSYFDYLASLDDLVILMDEAHRYHADASKKAINELRPILGLEMTATPTDEKGKPFKNIVYEYNLAQALADGKYVKIPTVARRRNFQKGNLSDKELDILKIEDAISIHERTKINLELYARNNHLPIVKPFVLIVCRNIQHATDIYHLVENELFNGKYNGKTLQIDSSTKKDEEIEKLFISLEKPDNQIEIVIHVNMLKEGWDVTNLYTIVPIRASNAPILIEQTIGRGLRLPYGKRTGNPDVDKLTVIAHENFEEIIEKAQDPNSVLNKISYIELGDNDLAPESGKIIPAKTIIDIQKEKALETAKNDIEKNKALIIADAQRAVWNTIPQLNRFVKSKSELNKPEILKKLRGVAIKEIEDSAKRIDPIFAEQIAAPLIKEVDTVINSVVKYFIQNIIEIPQITTPQKVYKTEFSPFDLDTAKGFDLPSLKNEIIRTSIGAGEKTVDTIDVISGHTPESPLKQIVEALTNYDDIDYGENAELLHRLAGQALDAIIKNAGGADITETVNQFKRAIAERIYEQMKKHFIMTPQGYSQPTVLPFTGIAERKLKEINGYGRTDFRKVIPPADVPKYIFTGFTKSYYTECHFDSKSEHDFANALECDNTVLHWLRPAPTQFNIYWANGTKHYEPDFIAETKEAIYMVETKASKDMTADDVQAKKAAAEEYCRIVSEYTAQHGGKPWHYALLAHNKVSRTAEFLFMLNL